MSVGAVAVSMDSRYCPVQADPEHQCGNTNSMTAAGWDLLRMAGRLDSTTCASSLDHTMKGAGQPYGEGCWTVVYDIYYTNEGCWTTTR